MNHKELRPVRGQPLHCHSSRFAAVLHVGPSDPFSPEHTCSVRPHSAESVGATPSAQRSAPWMSEGTRPGYVTRADSPFWMQRGGASWYNWGQASRIHGGRRASEKSQDRNPRHSVVSNVSRSCIFHVHVSAQAVG